MQLENEARLNPSTMYTPPVPAYTAAAHGSFAYETTVHRWPTIITQVVDGVYRRCHALTDGPAVAEGRRIIEEISGLKYAMSRDKPLEPIGAASGEPDLYLYDKHIQSTQPTWFRSEWCAAPDQAFCRVLPLPPSFAHFCLVGALERVRVCLPALISLARASRQRSGLLAPPSLAALSY